MPAPSWVVRPIVKVAASSPGGSTTTGTGSAYLAAKSRSRWSPHGQPKMAPVPYSISTKLAIQTGKVAPGRNGCATRSPVSTPRFSAVSIAASLVPRLRHSAMKAAAAGSVAATCAASGCSGATARNDMPNSVSGRVV